MIKTESKIFILLIDLVLFYRNNIGEYSKQEPDLQSNGHLFVNEKEIKREANQEI